MAFDPKRERAELLPEDLPLLDKFVSLLRTGRAASALVFLRQRLDEQELEDLARLLRSPRGESGRWGRG